MPETVETGMPKEDADRPSRKRSRLETRLWTSHGMEDVYFQREAQVNFWTVLGGLAMAALLTQLSPLLQEMQASRWYLILYLVASILVLANSWVQTSWGSLVLKWPISIATTVIMLFQMLAQSIQCLLITRPFGWLAATGGLIFFALCIQLYFQKSGAWEVSSPELIKRYKLTMNGYLFLMVICLAGAYQLYRFPSHLAEMVWGFTVIILSIMALYLQYASMQTEKKNLGIP